MKKITRDGFSLIETIMAIGLLSAGMIGFMQMSQYQQKQTLALSQKLGALDIQNFLIRLMADGTLCNYDLTNSASGNGIPLSFLSASPTILPLNALHLTSTSTTPWVTVSSTPSSIDQNVMVQSISLVNIQPAATPPNNIYTAQIQIAFNPTKLIQPLPPARAQVLLTTVAGTAPGSLKITGCTSTAAAPALNLGWSASSSSCGWQTYTCSGATLNVTAPLTCPASKYLVTYDPNHSYNCQTFGTPVCAYCSQVYHGPFGTKSCPTDCTACAPYVQYGCLVNYTTPVIDHQTTNAAIQCCGLQN